jgi:hypothetical protein
MSSALYNPYLDLFWSLPPACHRSRHTAVDARELTMPDWLSFKSDVAATYAWAVPTDDAIATIARHARQIVEIGSGSGYWAWMLEQAGIRVQAFDVASPRFTWHQVHSGTSADAARYPDHALFLCWPPWATSMAFDTLRAYRGQTVVYVGEWMLGSADARFFALLCAEFDAVDGAELPQWYMRDDCLLVFRRRGARRLADPQHIVVGDLPVASSKT